MAKKKTAGSSAAASDPAAMVRQYLRLKSQGKAAYRKADKLMAKLKDSVGVGVEIDAGSKGTYQIVDQFEENETVFRTVGVSRYELEETY